MLPAELPRPREPVAAPAVDTADVAVLFGSHLYAERDGGLIVRNGILDDWGFGVWFAPPGTHGPARLLVETEIGAVMPLGLSPAGDVGVVWLLPHRRGPGDPDCTEGIYLLSTETGDSLLVTTGAWWRGGADAGDDGVNIGEYHAGRDHGLPAATFSSNGRYVALAHGSAIRILKVATGEVEATHAGACLDWAWAPSRPTFVAGCADMTSAWVADMRRPEPITIALPPPQPNPASWNPYWEVREADSIGITPQGDVRVVRFYGYAPGCDSPGCGGPPPSYSVTTIDPLTTEITSEVRNTAFYVGARTRIGPDARWIHVSGRARTTNVRVVAVIDLGSGRMRDAPSVGEDVGQSIAVGVVYGSRSQAETRNIIVRSQSGAGTVREVGTIRWAEGSTLSQDGAVPAYGLVAVAVAS